MRHDENGPAARHPNNLLRPATGRQCANRTHPEHNLTEKGPPTIAGGPPNMSLLPRYGFLPKSTVGASFAASVVTSK